METTDTNKIIAAVEQTGFPFEHRTAMAFTDNGWHVVSNKYYVDDNSDEVREIDLIAYKVGKVEDLLVYSAVVVSCKKSNGNSWVFMTREIDPEDKNKDLTPLHFWTNDQALDYSLTRDGSVKGFTDRLTAKSPSIWSTPVREIFGFQELHPIFAQGGPNQNAAPMSYKTANDKATFSSITTLMKAQAYELGRLPDRRKEPSIYIFSLLTVMDGDMIEVSYDCNPPAVEETRLQTYIAHYIMYGKEQYCRINFTHKDRLNSLINEYDAAHIEIKRQVTLVIHDFYKTVFDSHKTIEVFSELLISRIILYVNLFGQFKDKNKLENADFSVSFNKDKKLVEIAISTTRPDEIVEQLNSHDAIIKLTKKYLKSIYRYDGDFKFLAGYPF